MHLSGQLSDWSIDDLLQIMQVTQKTGSLDITGEKRGRLHFKDGRVTGAELTGAHGTYTGTDKSAVADILYVLSTLEDGSFAVGPADGPEGSGWPTEDILSDVEALRSLEGEVVDAGLFEAHGLKLAEEVDEPVTIDVEDWRILSSLVQSFTFSELEEKMGRGGAVRVFHALHRLGVAAPVVTEEDGEWLDDLAQNLSPDPGDPAWLDPSPPAAEDDAIEEAEAPPAIEEPESDDELLAVPRADAKGVSAPASTTLTDGVYDEIRRLRSRVADDR